MNDQLVARKVKWPKGQKREWSLQRSAEIVFDIARQSNAAIGLAIEQGLPPRVVRDVAGRLKLTKKRLSEGVGLSVRTLDRKFEKKQRLSKEESATMVRVAKTRELAAKLFETDEAISDWLTQPDGTLGGRTPLSMLSNEFTAVEVENILNGMIQGFVA